MDDPIYTEQSVINCLKVLDKRMAWGFWSDLDDTVPANLRAWLQRFSPLGAMDRFEGISGTGMQLSESLVRIFPFL